MAKTELPLLYHYCSLDTAVAILRHGTLRMSSLYHMNDTLEHRWLFNKAKEWLRSAIDKREVKPIPEHFPKLLDLLNDDDEMIEADEVFCSCFSTESDSLGQWRAYADGGYGVAIGFDPKMLASWDSRRRFGGLELAEVCYDEDQQKLKLIDAITKQEQIIRPLTSDANNPVHVAFANLWSVAAKCKNPAFKEEKEWRIIYRPFTDADQSVNPPSKKSYTFDVFVRNKMVVPFYDLPIQREGDRKSPFAKEKRKGEHKICKAIKKIVFGPCAYKENERALDKYLTEKIYHGVEFEYSKASYRAV